MSAIQGQNNRRHKRVPLNLLVQVRIDNFSTFMSEHAVNISAGGMYLHSDRPRPLNSMIYFQFALTEGTSIIEGLGRVVRTDKQGMGIEFVGLDDRSKALIDHIIQQRLKKCA